jgi:hypothetical protein
MSSDFLTIDSTRYPSREGPGATLELSLESARMMMAQAPTGTESNLPRHSSVICFLIGNIVPLNRHIECNSLHNSDNIGPAKPVFFRVQRGSLDTGMHD